MGARREWGGDPLGGLGERHARHHAYQVIPGLPKTRSGKVMRRILRKVVEGQADQLGDVSNLADPSVVPAIVEGFTGA